MLMSAIPTIDDVRQKVSATEWQVRQELACAYRLAAYFKWDDIIFTHISARVPGSHDQFLLNPYELMFEEITASNLVKVSLDGTPVMQTPYTTNLAGFVIHSAIHAARPDAACVAHLHTPHGQAVSAMSEGLMPITQTALAVHSDLAYHHYEGIAVDFEEQERLVEDLGSKNAMILRNHGTLATGRSIGEAFVRLYYLERACEAQVLALTGGRDGINTPPQGAAEKVAQQNAAASQSGDNAMRDLAWPALYRKMMRLDPSFAS